MTMAILLPSSVESCRGDRGITSKEEEVCPSSPKNDKSVTMAILLPSSVESCGGDHGIPSKGEEVCPSSPKNDKSMTMAILLPSSVESCGSGRCHHLLEKRRAARFWKGVRLQLPAKMSSSEAGAMA